MTLNVFTKKDILQNLASRGFFIDIYTLDAFFAKNKIEAIFEDSSGNEFFDKNAFDIVLQNLFNEKNKINLADVKTTPIDAQDIVEVNSPKTTELNTDDTDTESLLKNISLSDGTPLINSVKDFQNIDVNNNIQNNQNIPLNQELQPPVENVQEPAQVENYDNAQTNFEEAKPVQENQPQINDPMQDDFDLPASNYTDDFDINQQNVDMLQNLEQMNDFFTTSHAVDILTSRKNDGFSSGFVSEFDENNEYDDITLVSESMEAQEKLRQYVVSELSKRNNNGNINNNDVSPKSSNEFKLDISERTLNMIARTMAKKIAKYVGSLMAQDAKQSSKVAEYQEENKRLTQKARELEEQNRKLRLLLAESNKNLNSYKPSFFGLYKKVDPNQNKK